MSLIQRANQAFNKGDYKAALHAYEQSALEVSALDVSCAYSMGLIRQRGMAIAHNAALISDTKRAVIFATYSAYAKVEDYVVYYLQHLAKVASYIVVVGDYHILDDQKHKLLGLVDHLIFEPHGEYDFGSYKRGYQHLRATFDENHFDEVIVCNDSCYGPVRSFEWLLVEMSWREPNPDFWGLTQNTEFGAHLQSYFLVLSRQVFYSAAFGQFILSVKREETVQEIILNYEVKLTAVLAAAGFAWDSYLRPSMPGMRVLLTQNSNPTVFPLFLLEQSAELVKVKATRDGGANVQGIERLLGRLMKENSALLSMIAQHHASSEQNRVYPFFSLILPVYNRADRVINSIESVLSQTYPHFELIVVDDGSSDEVVAVIEARFMAELTTKRIKLISHERNSGVSFARNTGLTMAIGEWVAYVDSDNQLTANALQIFAEQIHAHPETQCFYADWVGTSSQKRSSESFDYQRLLRANYIDLGVVIHRKSLLDQIGGFDCALKRLVDWEFMIRLSRDHAIRHIDQVLLHYHDDASAMDRISVKESYDVALSYIRNKHQIPYRLSVVVIPNQSLELFGSLLKQVSELAVVGELEVIVFDHTQQPDYWQLIESLAGRYSCIKANKTTESDLGINLKQLFGATRGDFVWWWADNALPDSLNKLPMMMQTLIEQPGWLAIGSNLSAPVVSVEGLSVLNQTNYLWRRHVVDKFIAHDRV